jgi:hypothetical protein
VTLEARPVGIFSQDFGIEAEGQQIAVLDVSCWKEAAEISIQDRPYRLYRGPVHSRAEPFSTCRPIGRFRSRVFVFWLVLVIWNRDAGAAAAAGGAG